MDKVQRAAYMLARYHARRAAAVERLGGRCVICGTTEDLDIDHILRSEKSFQISQLWSVSQERYDAEIDKCQLLCKTDHKSKNTWELKKKAAIRTHGTLSAYRYCKCDLCRKAYSDYWQTYKPRKKRPAPPRTVKGVRA